MSLQPLPIDEAPDSGGAPASKPEKRRRNLPSVAATGLFLLAAFYTLYFARAFILPLVLAVLLALLLAPAVAALRRLKIPEFAGAALVTLGLFGLLGFAVYRLAEPAGDWIDRGPRVFQRLESKLREIKEPVEKVTQATEKVEELARVDGGAQRGEPVEVKRTSLRESLFRYAWQSTVTIGLVLILLFFLLASGDLFLRKLIRVLPTLADKRRAVEIARQLQSDISMYLATITLINIVLGVAVGLAMHFLDMPNPALWGVLATLLNFIPYLGAIAGIATVGVVALLTFDNLGQAVVPPLAYFLLTSLEGYFLTPMIVGRRLTLNPVVILLAILFWGWLWGVPGALLAVPMIASFKIFCDHIERLAPIGEFLGH